MSDFFEYQEVACPRCGHLNRRFGTFLLNGRYASQCDHCGVELVTGRFSVFGAIYRGLVFAGVYFLCSLIGVFAALVGLLLLGWLLLGSRYDALRVAITYLALAVGIAGGVLVAERQRRRGGFGEARRVVRDAPDERARPPALTSEAPPDQPESHAAVRTRMARHWYLGIGYAAGVIGGVMLAPPTLRALGLEEWIEPMIGIGIFTGLGAGWAWGRWKHAPPASGDGVR